MGLGRLAPDTRASLVVVAGAIVLVVILLAFPLLVGIGSSVIAALLGISLNRDVEIEHVGSELIDVNT